MAWQTKCYKVSAQPYTYQNVYMARQGCLLVGADVPYFADASDEQFLRYVIAKEANSVVSNWNKRFLSSF
jgi:hypothetical protein